MLPFASQWIIMTVFTNITIPLLVGHIFCLGSLDSIFSFFINILFYLYTFLSLFLFLHSEKVRSNHFLVLVTSRLLCEYLKHPPICIMVFRRNPFSNHTPTVSFSDSRSFFVSSRCLWYLTYSFGTRLSSTCLFCTIRSCSVIASFLCKRIFCVFTPFNWRRLCVACSIILFKNFSVRVFVISTLLRCFLTSS